jgi:hypothetical protein
MDRRNIINDTIKIQNIQAIMGTFIHQGSPEKQTTVVHMHACVCVDKVREREREERELQSRLEICKHMEVIL